MTFEQHYGDRPPDGPTDADGYEARKRWEDRRAVWIKAQLEMQEACAAKERVLAVADEMETHLLDYDALAQCHPALARGQVWCLTCGRNMIVNPAQCLATGWPTCCGYTMSIDQPKEAPDAS